MRDRRRNPGWIHAFAVAMLAGCDRAAPPASVPSGTPVIVRRVADAGTSDFVSQQLALRASGLPPGFALVGRAERGTLPEGGRASHPFDVQANHCYRVLAVGGVDVSDIDLLLFGPDNTQIDGDTQGDNYPILGAARPLCPPSGGTYRVEVLMHQGQGEYAVAVYATR